MRTFNFRVTENLEPDDVFLIDGPGGTRTIKVSDAIPSNSDLIQQINERTSYGVVTGLNVAAQSTPDMTVDVSSGIIYMLNGNRFEPTPNSTLAVTEADTSNPRVDIAYVNSTGIISYLAGTASATPSAPSVPDGCQLLAEISVGNGATTIASTNIKDRRKYIATEAVRDAALLSNWVNYGVGFANAGYYRDYSGIVHLVGMIKSGTTTAGTVIMVLPEGYRPVSNMRFATTANGGIAILDVESNGNVKIVTVGSSAYLTLGTINF